MILIARDKTTGDVAYVDCGDFVISRPKAFQRPELSPEACSKQQAIEAFLVGKYAKLSEYDMMWVTCCLAVLGAYPRGVGGLS